MDFSLTSFLIGAAAVIAAVAVLYKMGDDDGTSADDVEHSDPALREIYAAATQLNAFFQVAAHPADVVKHDQFEKGVVKLVAGAFTEEDLVGYALGENAMLACLAIEALRRKFDSPELRTRLLNSLDTMATPPCYVTLRYLDASTPAGDCIAGPAIVAASEELWNDTFKGYLEEFCRKRAEGGETLSFGDALSRLNESYVYEVEQFIAGLTGVETETLTKELGSRQKASADPSLLKTMGRVWDERTAVEASDILEHDTLTKLLDRLEASLEADPARSALVVGETGVGKSSAINKLAARLHAKGWTIFVAGHADLIAGQVYIGQFEERLNQMIELLTAGERILWMIPGFDALAFSGRHKYSPVSALDTILPYVERGELKIVGETSRAAYERLAMADPRLTNTLSVNRIDTLTTAGTMELGNQWLKRWTKNGNERTLKEAWHLAQHFLGETAAPGNLLKFLKLTRQRLIRGKPQDTRPEVTQDDLLTTLVELTGLSEVMLDDERTLDLDGLRSHFHKRVIGQDEAITCLVERVAMIKAGVTDPTRPAGVFLFAGPTGTGKTEIAKTLTEWLFGSPDRMIRLDMSELQTADSLDRLIGSEAAGGGALTDLIQEQPFTIVLLDEFEKAHPNIWDLFLQVFDDGRLTDSQGRTADFRHAIIILTSNLGAAIPTDTPIGFAGQTSGFDAGTVLGEVEKVFRREFINRIDRVVVFRPLSRDVMRDILEKELDAAFQRRGLRSRSWAVEWDASAIDFLLDQGFTPDLGARPLKRAIDRHLLAPLAQTIVNRQVPAGDQFLFVTQRDGALAVDFVDPDASTEPGADGAAGTGEQPKGLTLRAIVLQPGGTQEEFAFLFDRIAALQDLIASDAWRQNKEETIAFLELPDFWSSPERFEVLGQVEHVDRMESALVRVGSLLRRIGGPGAGRENYPTNIIKAAAQSLYLIETARDDLQGSRPREAYVLVESGRQSGASGTEAAAFAGRIADMYTHWAKKRRMHFNVLTSKRDLKGDDFQVVIAVSGFGAHSILAEETGLHVLEQPAADTGKTRRISVRVTVVPQPADPGDASAETRRKQAREAFAAFEFPSRKVVRRYREEPSPLVRDAAGGWRTGRLDKVLDGEFDLFE